MNLTSLKDNLKKRTLQIHLINMLQNEMIFFLIFVSFLL